MNAWRDGCLLELLRLPLDLAVQSMGFGSAVWLKNESEASGNMDMHLQWRQRISRGRSLGKVV